MEESFETFMQQMKETNPLHWAAFVLADMQNWLSARHDCTERLHLEATEQRRKFAEAINLALEEIDGKTVLGIFDGKEGHLMRCRPEEKEYILEQIGQHITEGARYIMVNISDGADLVLKEPPYSLDDRGQNP